MCCKRCVCVWGVLWAREAEPRTRSVYSCKIWFQCGGLREALRGTAVYNSLPVQPRATYGHVNERNQAFFYSIYFRRQP